MSERSPLQRMSTKAREIGAATLKVAHLGHPQAAETSGPQLPLSITDPMRALDERFNAALRAQGHPEGLELQNVVTAWCPNGQRPSASDLARLSPELLDVWANMGGQE